MSYYNPSRIIPDSSNDRKTRVLNKLIYGLFRKDILSDKSTLRSLYLVKSYTHCYTIVFEMDGNYRSYDTLNWIIISTVDKILEWWDITDSYNLDIECITRGRTPINKNYFELLFHAYNKNRNNRGYSRDGVDNFHPRFENMCRWMYNNKCHEYNEVLNKTYDPYRFQENPQSQVLIQQRAQFRGEGIQPGYSDYSRAAEDFYQQSLELQRQLSQGQMSLRWSDYETNDPCEEIELPNVIVTQRVTKSKLNKLLNKLKW